MDIGVDFDSHKVVAIDCGGSVWSTMATEGTISERAFQLSNAFSAYIRENRPTRVFLEEVSTRFHNLVRTVYRVQVLLENVLVEQKVPYHLLRTTTWKKWSVGHGRSSKTQVIEWASKDLRREVSSDVADAYAILVAGIRKSEESDAQKHL